MPAISEHELPPPGIGLGTVLENVLEVFDLDQHREAGERESQDGGDDDAIPPRRAQQPGCEPRLEAP
jgi:hypothetical protein